jgi:hypothetical protein
MHFARQKQNGQAAMLVKRLKRWTAALPGAEVKLAELRDQMDQTPAAERDAFVQAAKEELKGLAESEYMLPSVC